MKDSRLEIKLSPKLKQRFETLCEESEISMSNKMRELITNLVKNYEHQKAKASLDK